MLHTQGGMNAMGILYQAFGLKKNNDEGTKYKYVLFKKLNIYLYTI